MSIKAQGESGILYRIGLGWWTRQKIELWVKRSPRAFRCFIRRKHEWGEKMFTLDVGPLDIHPYDRDYGVLGAMVQCEKCWKTVMVDHTPEEEETERERAIAEDLEEWVDPEYQKWVRSIDDEMGDYLKDIAP